MRSRVQWSKPPLRRHSYFLRSSPVLAVPMVTTPILSTATSFTTVQRVRRWATVRVRSFVHVFLLGWQSMMECDEGLAYSTRDRECVPLDLSDCAPARG